MNLYHLFVYIFFNVSTLQLVVRTLLQYERKMKERQLRNCSIYAFASLLLLAVVVGASDTVILLPALVFHTGVGCL